MTGQSHVEILAHHELLLAIPALIPAIALAGVVIYIAMRDRRTPEKADTSKTSDKSE